MATDCTGSPTDVKMVLLIDSSGSMWKDYYGQTRLAATKSAAKTLINSLEIPPAVVGVHRFPQDLVELADPLVFTGDSATLNSRIDALIGNGVESLYSALLVGWEWLQSQSGSDPTLIMITDGYITGSDAVDYVNSEIKPNGGRVIVISINPVEELDGQPGVSWDGFHPLRTLHQAIATSPDDYHSAYESNLDELFENLSGEVQECEEADPPEAAKKPKDQQCPQPCDGWNVNNGADLFNETDCGIKEVKIPPEKPKEPDPQYTRRDICENLIDNGDFEDNLNHWNVLRNDGFVELPFSGDTNSTVLRFGYFGVAPDAECVNVLRNDEFDSLEAWSVQHNDGYVRIIESSSCSKSLLMERTLANEYLVTCSDHFNHVPITDEIWIYIDNCGIAFVQTTGDCNALETGVPARPADIDISASGNLTGATLQIDPANGGSLSFDSPVAAITGNYNATSGTLTLSGSASAAEYQVVLNSVLYSNPGPVIVPVKETFTMTLSDGTTHSCTMSVTDPSAYSNKTSVDIDLLGSASDPDGDPLTIASIGAVTVGDLIDNGDGTVTWESPELSALSEGQEITFHYAVSDEYGGVAINTVHLVCGAPPVAPSSVDLNCPGPFDPEDLGLSGFDLGALPYPLILNPDGSVGCDVTDTHPAYPTPPVTPPGTAPAVPIIPSSVVINVTSPDGTTSSVIVNINPPAVAPVAVDFTVSMTPTMAVNPFTISIV